MSDDIKSLAKLPFKVDILVASFDTTDSSQLALINGEQWAQNLSMIKGEAIKGDEAAIKFLRKYRHNLILNRLTGEI